MNKLILFFLLYLIWKLVKKTHLKIKAARVCRSLPIGVKVNKFYFSETAWAVYKRAYITGLSGFRDLRILY